MSDTCTQPTGTTHAVSTPIPGLDAELLRLFSQALRAVADSGRAVLLDYSAAGDAALRPGACRTGRATAVDGAPAALPASCGVSPRRVAVVAPGPFTVRVTGPAPPAPSTFAGAGAEGAALRGCKAVLGYLLGPECRCGAPGCVVPRVPLGRVFGAGPRPNAVSGATSEASHAGARPFDSDGDPEAFDAWAALWLPAVELLRRMPGDEGVGAKPSEYALTGRAFALVAALYGWGLDSRGQCVRLVRG